MADDELIKISAFIIALIIAFPSIAIFEDILDAVLIGLAVVIVISTIIGIFWYYKN